MACFLALAVVAVEVDQMVLVGAAPIPFLFLLHLLSVLLVLPLAAPDALHHTGPGVLVEISKSGLVAPLLLLSNFLY